MNSFLRNCLRLIQMIGENHIFLFIQQAYIIADNQDGDGEDLVPIEDDKEWDMVEEVLNTFLDNDGNFKA